MTVYANGVASMSTNTDTTPFAATGSLVIGHGEFNGAATSYFTGNIADVQTYSAVLTAAQVSAIYTGAQVAGSGAALAGPVQARAVFTGGPGGTSPATGFTFDPNNAAGATSSVGPGSVNLVNGALSISASDVSVDAYGSDLTTARTFNTRLSGLYDATHMFGPGWTSTATVADADSPYGSLMVSASLVQVSLPDGSTIGFTNSATSGKFVPQVGDEDLTLTYTTGTTPYYTLSDQDGDVTTFTQITGAPVGQYTPTAVTEPGSGQTTSMTWQTATVDGVTVTRPTQILAPVAAGVTCTTLVKGCRALTFSYAATTTATGTTQATWGDYTGRVKTISFIAWDPATSAMKTISLAGYQYDSNGRLAAQWDPRLDDGTTHLWTTYSYNTDGTLATETDNTQPAWNFTYITLPSDLGIGRLASISRSALTAGTATTTVVYGVPVSGAGAPYDLSVGQTSRWDEQAAPVQATAVFDAGQIPAGNQATGTLPTSWTRATMTYMDANSQAVNTITPGGYIDTTWLDQFGNTVRSLTANNRLEDLNASGTDTPSQEALLADAVSTLNIYSSDGTQLLTVLAPQHNITLSTGAVVAGRDLTQNTYDEGAPVGACPCGLVTTAVAGVRWWDTGGVQHDADTKTTKTTYDWTLKEPLVSAVDPTGLNLTTTTTYDSTTGLTTSVTAPAGTTTTNTPATTKTTYYSTAANATYPECGLHAEWANLVCRTGPGGQAASGPEIPATETTYDIYNNPTVVTEKTSAGTLRTTTTTYDTDGRVYTTAITGAAGTGTAIPTTRNVYDPATGNLTNIQTLNSGGTVTAYTTSVYDALNRVTSYTDTDSVQSTTTYDLMSRPSITSDGLQSTTTSYDTGGENRGLATQIADGQAGSITGTYDADGNVIQENWPNGIVVNHTYNETGTQTAITYSEPGCGLPDCTLYTQTDTLNAADDIAGDISTLSTQTDSYDADNRLTTVTDTVSGQCETRAYGFGTSVSGKASDRTSLTDYGPGTGGACQTTTSSSSTTWTYDTADRIDSTSASSTTYAYDSLARTSTIPAADTQTPDGGNLTVAYTTNDLVYSIQQGSSTASIYTLDVDNQRIRSWTDADGAHLNHYNDTSDNPSWTNDVGTYERNIDGPAGLAAVGTVGGIVTWQISDLHGDVVATIDNSDTVLDTVNEADEYGNMRNTAAVGTLRYGWLGTKQRAADNPDGIILMGVRLYNPATGRFLSTDPVPGGSCNRYDYTCQDPTNGFDLDGQCWTCHLHWRRAWHAAVPHFRAARHEFAKAGHTFWHTDITQDCWHGALVTSGVDGVKSLRAGEVASRHGSWTRFKAGRWGRSLLGSIAYWAVAGCFGNIIKNRFFR